jgi:regulator of RNase E activity RraA
MRMTRRSLLKASAAAMSAPTLAMSQETGLENASASLVADALRAVGHDPRTLTMSRDIRPVTTPGATIVGPAVTTKWELAREGMAAASIRKFVFEPIDRAGPGSIWVVESGTDQLLSMFGDLIGLACKRQGLAGAVTDSGCRDVGAMDAIDFPVFAKGTVLYGPGDIIRPVAADTAVVCGGVAVSPGDTVVADIDGVIVVPKDGLGLVARAMDGLVAKEEGVRRKIENGETLASAYSL